MNEWQYVPELGGVTRPLGMDGHPLLSARDRHVLYVLINSKCSQIDRDIKWAKALLRDPHLAKVIGESILSRDGNNGLRQRWEQRQPGTVQIIRTMSRYGYRPPIENINAA